MSWQADWAATALFFAIVATVMYAAVFIFEFRERLKLKGGKAIHVAFFVALTVIGFFYALEFVTGPQLPPFHFRTGSSGIADVSWLNFHAINALLTVGLIALGLVVTARGIRSLLAAVEDREQRFRAFFDNAPMSMSLKDQEGRFLLINETHEKWLGLPAKAIIGKTMREIVDDPARTESLSETEKFVLESNQTHEATLRARKSDGKIHDRVVTKFPVKSWDGSPARIGTITVDISERRRAEAVLRASETRLSGIVNIAFDAIIVVDRKQYISIFNKGAEKIFGYRAEEAIGRPLEMLIPEAFRATHGGKFAAFERSPDISRPMSDRGEIAGMRRDGTTFPAEASISKLELGGETVFTVFLRDITDRKQRENALRDSERNLRAILENSPIGVAILAHTRVSGDVAVKRLFVNDSLVEMFGGTTREAMVAADVSGTWADPDQLRAVNEALENGVDLVDFEAWRRRLDGVELWISMNTRPIHFNGQTCTMVWHFDITERKQAADALKKSEQLFKAVVENSPAAISLKDAEGRYLIMNRKYKEWLTVSDKDYIGNTAHDLIAKEIADTATAHDKLVMESGVPDAQERQVTFPDGVTRTIWVHKFPIVGPEGECTGVGAASLDVTEQRNTENQLRQAQKMEAVGQLTGGIAHDFNNLLGVIIGNLDFLTEELQDNAGLLALTEAATKAALSGAALNRQLLAFSRKQSLSPRVIDLNDHVSDMLDMLRRTLGVTIEVKTKLSPGPWTANVDPAQLESAVLNLAVNARDAMPAGGSLTIETMKIRLDDEYAARFEVTPGDYVTLAVTDTGTGMPPDVLAQVFEPFFTTKDVGNGSGLGLSMVFGFTKQSGGHVEIESEPGRGTTVTLYLPYARREIAAAQNATEQIPLAKGETVLVVENSPELLKLAGNWLDGLGYRVLAANDGKSALTALDRAADVDLLLTDMLMPGGMTGPALASEAATRQSGIKVLYMSGQAEETTRRPSPRATDLLRKPFRKPELARMVRSALDT